MQSCPFGVIMSHKKKELINPQSLGLPAGGVDSHAHLTSTSDKLWSIRDEVLQRAKNCGISYIGEVFLSHIAYHEKKDYFQDKRQVFFIYGLHPTDLLKIDATELENIKKDITIDKNSTKRIRAVGEIGLDFYWKDVPNEMQEDYFRRQLIMAKELNLPVVIHSRDAFDDTLRILLDAGYSQLPLLWHCFDGDKEKAQTIISHGWHISIPGSITYKPNSATREALHFIPKDKLMLETDCPYLSPEPWRGKTNEPALIVFTAQCVANELNRDIAELWISCGKNARDFFSL